MLDWQPLMGFFLLETFQICVIIICSVCKFSFFLYVKISAFCLGVMCDVKMRSGFE